MIRESTAASGAYETALDAPDYKAMYEMAELESRNCYDRMAKMRIEYEDKLEYLTKELDRRKRENEMLEAQLYIVRLIFGGNKE